MRRLVGRLILLGASACGAADAPPDVSEADSEIGNNGNIDYSNEYKYVGALTNPGDGSMLRCSGTLVTRRWVLSARHCFLDPDRRKNAIDFVVGLDPSQADPKSFFSKTKSRDVEVRTTVPLDTGSDDEISRDIALVHLNRKVKPFVVAPKHPSMVAGSCGDEFGGRIVGYGANIDECPDPDIPLKRRYAYSEDWSRSYAANGIVYEEEGSGDTVFL